ncbi:MAG: hypothetical protein MZV64_13310 [Ignavibacteriales bacterium]|nr:hypothetical protein [Ignavibacteriales bacterium]
MAQLGLALFAGPGPLLPRDGRVLSRLRSPVRPRRPVALLGGLRQGQRGRFFLGRGPSYRQPLDHRGGDPAA